MGYEEATTGSRMMRLEDEKKSSTIPSVFGSYSSYGSTSNVVISSSLRQEEQQYTTNTTTTTTTTGTNTNCSTSSTNNYYEKIQLNANEECCEQFHNNTTATVPYYYYSNSRQNDYHKKYSIRLMMIVGVIVVVFTLFCFSSGFASFLPITFFETNNSNNNHKQYQHHNKYNNIPFDLSSHNTELLTMVKKHASNTSPTSNNKKETTTSTTTTTSITFQEYAKSVLPSKYLEMLQGTIAVWNDNVQPADVYTSRKLMLKTRDLLDVFSPVYPNVTTFVASSKNNNKNSSSTTAIISKVDLWEKVRHIMDTGYEVLGEFQDLDHAHVNYTKEIFDTKQNAVLQWRNEFRSLHDENFDDVYDYISSPSKIGSFRHKSESKLFWKTIISLPSGSNSAIDSLHILKLRQTATALTYLKLAYPYESVIETIPHEYYHNLRKELRSITDEYDLIDTSIMFPEVCSLPTITILKVARKKLGDINDDWSAYDIYNQTNLYPNEQKRLIKKINLQWQEFRFWINEVNLEGALRCFTS